MSVDMLWSVCPLLVTFYWTAIAASSQRGSFLIDTNLVEATIIMYSNNKQTSCSRITKPPFLVAEAALSVCQVTWDR